MRIANLNGVCASEAGKIDACNLVRIPARAVGNGHWASNRIAIMTHKAMFHRNISFVALLIVVIGVLALAHPTQANADDRVEEIRQEFIEQYKKYIKLDAQSPEARDIWARLQNLKSQLSRIDLSAALDLFDDAKAAVEKKTKVILDDTEEEFENPKDFIPWPVKNWPPNARKMADKDFMKRLDNLEDSPTEWARKTRRKFFRMSVDELYWYFLSFIKRMYVNLEGTTWAKLLKRRKKINIFFGAGELFEEDVERFTRSWAEGKIKDDLIRDVFDKHNMGKSKSKPSHWYWLEFALRIIHVKKKYEVAQKNLRDVLLEVDTKWDLKKYSTWTGKIDKFALIIINSEKRMIWLLGYSDNESLQKLGAAEKFKANALSMAQKEFLEAYLRKRWFDEMNTHIKLMPPGGSVDDRNEVTSGKEKSEKAKEKFDKVYKISKSKLEKIRANIDDGGKYGIMKRGIYRAFSPELPIFLKLHLFDKSDDFFKRSLGDREYDRLKERFSVLKEDDVFKEFFNKNKREIKEFDAQNELRRKIAPQIR